MCIGVVPGCSIYEYVSFDAAGQDSQTAATGGPAVRLLCWALGKFFCVMFFSYMCFLTVHQNVLPSTCLQYGVTSYCRMLTCCCLRDASFCCLFILLLLVVVRISVIYTVYTSGLFMCLT